MCRQRRSLIESALRSSYSPPTCRSPCKSTASDKPSETKTRTPGGPPQCGVLQNCTCEAWCGQSPAHFERANAGVDLPSFRFFREPASEREQHSEVECDFAYG